jgi:capsular exopolysaccharide synthesis family protein
MSKIHQAIRRAEKESMWAQPKSDATKNHTLEKFQAQAKLSFSVNTMIPSPAQAAAKAVFVDDLDGSWSCQECSLSPAPQLVTLSGSESAAGRAYQELKSQLVRIKQETGFRSFLVTSADKSEGKSLTAVNLSIALAQEGEGNTLLVDANLRAATAHQLLGLAIERGLTDTVKDGLLFKDVVVKAENLGLFFLAAGSPSSNPAELLNTQRTRNLLASAKARFDWVIVDAPPVIDCPETGFLASFVDATILVVRPRANAEEKVREGLRILKGYPLVGTVVNGIS